MCVYYNSFFLFFYDFFSIFSKKFTFLGAPNVGGNWTSEAYSQAWLVLESLRVATEHLRPGGTFVTKVFRSKEYTALLYALEQLFEKVGHPYIYIYIYISYHIISNHI